MEINSTGVFLGTKAAVPAMQRAGGGSIINISSICGIVGSHANAAYHASKGAVRIFSKAAAIQYAPDRIRVNSVHPGFVDTPMTVPGHSNPEVARKRIEATPLGRFGTPYDIAAGCLYLASDESSWVTGNRAGDRWRDDGELIMAGGAPLEWRVMVLADHTTLALRSTAQRCVSKGPSRCCPPFETRTEFTPRYSRGALLG